MITLIHPQNKLLMNYANTTSVSAQINLRGKNGTVAATSLDVSDGPTLMKQTVRCIRSMMSWAPLHHNTICLYRTSSWSHKMPFKEWIKDAWTEVCNCFSTHE